MGQKGMTEDWLQGYFQAKKDAEYFLEQQEIYEPYDDTETWMKLMKTISTKQPDWVCFDCGEQWGRWYEDGEYFGPSPHYSTNHMGKCSVCEQVKSVTEARDYGFLRKGWDKKVAS